MDQLGVDLGFTMGKRAEIAVLTELDIVWIVRTELYFVFVRTVKLLLYIRKYLDA